MNGMWIELTTDQHKIWINMDHMASIAPLGRGAMIAYAVNPGDGASTFTVDQSPDTIMSLMRVQRGA
ncbi:hypothetical protein GCM10011335_52500 [Aureimonas glaciei]|uniref:Uncharacterized protein n=1 Tax=Aureimonas glaciei TaxID=1776957 RepID=A0A917DIT4_9HYPH|nr:hypothetical protein GCM10011335_52500 [Aureimonas glaciei]